MSSETQLLLGDEAVALAAMHEGLSGAYGYPGTPSTEIIEYIKDNADKYGIVACWAANEKVAYEQALGMSFAGKKTIVTMKHVGLNVAMDPFMSSAITGVHGELVAVVADDPGMHSSQNEQDSRVLAKFALLPCFEPSTQQQAYDMTREAFRLSKAVKLPIVMRLVTRLAHSRSAVRIGSQVAQNPMSRCPDKAAFTLLPVNARRQYGNLVEMQKKLQEYSEKSSFNTLDLSGSDRSLGIIATGIAMNYVKEAFDGKVPHPYLHVCVSPMPLEKLRQLASQVKEIMVFEDGQPLVEEQLRGVLGTDEKRIRGRLDGSLPRTGELDPANVAKALNRGVEVVAWPTLEKTPGRPPALCAGCPHQDSYFSIKDALAEHPNGTVFSDIGCYTLGFFPPYNAVDTTVEMGASIGMAIGAAQAGLFPAIATIGDSTFMHSGVTCLATAVREKANIVVCILDNDITAMTGGQESIANGDTLKNIVLGVGVDPEHLVILNPHPKHRAENSAKIRDEINWNGVSVIIARRACIQIKKTK